MNTDSSKITCSICQKATDTSKAFHRWGVSFCTLKCHNVRLVIETAKIEEAEKKKLKDFRAHASLSDGCGGC